MIGTLKAVISHYCNEKSRCVGLQHFRKMWGGWGTGTGGNRTWSTYHFIPPNSAPKTRPVALNSAQLQSNTIESSLQVEVLAWIGQEAFATGSHSMDMWDADVGTEVVRQFMCGVTKGLIRSAFELHITKEQGTWDPCDEGAWFQHSAEVRQTSCMTQLQDMRDACDEGMRYHAETQPRGGGEAHAGPRCRGRGIDPPHSDT